MTIKGKQRLFDQLTMQKVVHANEQILHNLWYIMIYTSIMYCKV